MNAFLAKRVMIQSLSNSFGYNTLIMGGDSKLNI